jgi:hypothetical protein
MTIPETFEFPLFGVGDWFFYWVDEFEGDLGRIVFAK